jgi:hypothetical protein
MAYTTVSDVKLYLGITEDGDDALIKLLIDAAQKAIDGYCHRTFEATADSTRYFDYSSEFVDGAWLILNDEICSITTVTNGDNVEVTSAQYTTWPRNTTPYTRLRILSNSGKYWTYTDEWMDAISIAGRWAYSTAADDNIKQACTRLASFYYRQKDSPLTDVTAIEAGTVIRTPGIPSDVKMILDNGYKKP